MSVARAFDQVDWAVHKSAPRGLPARGAWRETLEVPHMIDSSTGFTSVYLYHDEFDILLYVGITSRGMARQREHNAQKVWWPLVARQEIEHHDCRAAALDRERHLIETQRPPFNKQHNGQAKIAEASYLAFRKSVDPSRTLLEQATVIGRRLPILMTKIGDGRWAEFITDPRYPLVARAISDLGQIKIRTSAGVNVGHVARTRHEGPSVVIEAIMNGKFSERSNGWLRFIVPPVGRRHERIIQAKNITLAGGH